MAVRSKPKHRVEFEPRTDNTPTPERRQHSEFRVAGGKAFRICTVESLHNSGDINDDALAAAARWFRDYVFADYGASDRDPNKPRDDEAGDIHTHGWHRGKASERISLARSAIGMCGHQLLVMMLIRELSFTRMAEILHPGISPTAGRAKISAKCAFALELLAEHQKTERIRAVRKNELARACELCD